MKRLQIREYISEVNKLKISKIQINHMTEPAGFQLASPLWISAELTGAAAKTVSRRLVIKATGESIYDTGIEEGSSLIFQADVDLQPRSRYEVEIFAKSGEEETSASSFFETGYMSEDLLGKWIGDPQKDRHGVIFRRRFTSQNVQKARLYITALGLYEVWLDGQKLGSEFLAPGFTDYNYYLQRAVYDASPLLAKDGEHDLEIMVADGWYRGKLGLKQHGGIANNYGDQLMAVCDLRMLDENGQEEVITTDESWDLVQSPVPHSGIYYGEDFDPTLPKQKLGQAALVKPVSRYIVDRLSLPITKHEVFPAKLINTPSGDCVLDFGQNLAGWVEFKNCLPRGEKVEMQFGEILQNGEFYRDNLRSARASFTYVSDGEATWVRPHFSYFGFRYAKLTGFGQVDPKDFKAVALYSDMAESGWLKSSRADVNRLFENIKWGQKSNFIDVPTDCPQRDERLGWTGDAAVFAKTAAYNMDCYEFFKKFSYDMAIEQSQRAGKLPLYVPSVGEEDGGKAVWSDASVIIPWQAYSRSLDPAILKQNIGAMMSWVDWVHDRALAAGNDYLWLGDDQLGDWLALDAEDIMHLKGKTDDDLIASAFYYHSASLVAQSAQVLNMKHEQQYYRQLAKLIKQAFLEEFFTKSGRPLADTQTGLAICLSFGLYPDQEKDRLVRRLVDIIEKNHNHLSTGFVGTPLLLPALSRNGEHALAVRLFLNNDFPSWLYEVEHGATTIWERWDSVDDQGKIAQNGMNSLNHYSSGAVMQWAYEDLLGLKQAGNLVTWQPRISPEFTEFAGQIALPAGSLTAGWEIISPSEVKLTLIVPFGSQVKLDRPEMQKTFGPGSYEFTIKPDQPLVKAFDVHTPLKDYCQIASLAAQLQERVPFWGFLTAPGNLDHFQDFSLYQLSQEMRGIGFKPLDKDEIKQIKQLFQNYSLQKASEVAK